MKKKILALMLCLMVAMSAVLTGCGKDKEDNGKADGVVSKDVEATVVGEGEKVLNFTVVDAEGNETAFEVHTDKDTVGEALFDAGLIEGEDGPYGLYVKTVNGITADADKDGAYWGFFVNGEASNTGVDMTDAIDGDSYSFEYIEI